MYVHALAADYDGTLAEHGRVDESTLAALRRLRASGRRLILVTGRELDDLRRVFDHFDLFDRIVAENGALLYCPADRTERPLAEPPPTRFVERLRERGVAPLSVGRVIVATWEPQQTAVLETIRELGLELQIIFNKGAVMVLPAGVTKASGLSAALAELGLSELNAVAVGDAENDHALLRLCGYAAAVANALPMLKETADLVTAGARGAGVVELIDRLLADDLASVELRDERFHVPLGTAEDGRLLTIGARGAGVLVAGTSGSGKSTFAAGLLERVAERGHQFCIVDPEGDYEGFAGAVTVGDADHPPDLDEAFELLRQPDQNVVVNMLGIAMADRPALFAEFLHRLQSLRSETGRPHWLAVDEAHHMLPVERAGSALPQIPGGAMLVTVHPDHVAPAALAAIGTVVVVGATPAHTVEAFCRHIGAPCPAVDPAPLPSRRALAWAPGDGGAPTRFQVLEPQGERRRHLRKYAKGELGEDRSFHFRGPGGRLNLRAQNLELFVQTAAGVDDETWLYHLGRSDYSAWLREAVKDHGLAEEVAAIERQPRPDPAETRERIRQAIERRYAGAA